MKTLKNINSIINKKNKILFSIGIITTIISVILSLISPLVNRFIIDSVLDNKPIELPFFLSKIISSIGSIEYIRNNLIICGLILIVIQLISSIFVFVKDRTISVFAETTTKDLKDKLYDHIQNLPYDYLNNSQAGDILQRCTSDVETTRKFLAGQGVQIFRTICIVFFGIIMMINVNIKLTIVSLIFIPFLIFYSVVFFKKAKEAFEEYDVKEGEMSTVLQENLSGIRVVRAFNKEKFEIKKFEQKNSELSDLNMKIIYLLSNFWGFTDLLCFLQMAIVLGFSVYLAFQNEITVGTILLFNSYSRMFVWPVRELGRLLNEFGKTIVATKRIFEILEVPEEEFNPNDIKPDLFGDIVFSNVNFKYNDNSNVLENINFTVKAGETIAILGTTGSGKSTLIHLLLRLYDYKNGSIKINNTELNTIDKNWLRKKISVVLQEPFLYSRTIEDNLKMSKENVDILEIYNATKIASIHSDIENFKEGYKTPIGEKGVTLSGGQKQRVAIARSIIKNSNILIFDDSLSAVDTETDSQIRNELNSMTTKITTFIISQRITTLMEADKIIVMEDGKITSIGSHKELIKNDGLYSRIWEIQTMLEDDFDSEVV